MDMYLKLFISTLLIVFVHQVESNKNRACITPNKEHATCVPIYSCEVFVRAVKFADASQKKYMQESLCGYFRNVPVVCCGTTNNYKQSKKRTKRNTSHRSVVGESECGLSRFDDRPNGGKVTLDGEFPWSARFHYNRSKNAKTVPCEGTLINKRYVLTAGLCITSKTQQRLGRLTKVNLGEHNCRRHENCEDKHVEIGIEEVILHEYFSSKGYVTKNDIGLVKLDRDVSFNDEIRPICLPKSNEEAGVGEWVTETGWSISNKEKLKADLPVVSFEECSELYAPAGVTVTTSQLCAGGESKHSCAAISGGSLMTRRKDTSPTRWYLEGIVSFGPRECAINGLPNVYTKVNLYLNWIQSKVRM